MTVALSRLNFRDLGGLPTTDGRRLRAGLLYRSEGPANFAAEHRAELGAIGFRLICDLRAHVERDMDPNDWSSSARLLNLDVTNDLRTETNAGWTALRDDPSAAGAANAMILNYKAIPGALHPYMRTLIDAMLDGEVPVLMHCTAGKDRTGVLVALLLSLLGVDRAEVLRDYERSDIFARNLRLGGSIAEAFNKTFGFIPSEATIAAMIGVDPAFLEAAYGAVEGQWGTVEAFFETAGIDPVRRERLRALLLSDAAA